MGDIHGTREELVAMIIARVADIDRLQEAKRRALAIADERSKENAALRAALKPFAIYAAGIAKDHPGWDHDDFSFQLPDHGPTMRAFRAALAAFGIGHQ